MTVSLWREVAEVRVSLHPYPQRRGFMPLGCLLQGDLRLDGEVRVEPAHVERGVLDPDVRTVVEDPGLDPAGLARGDDADPVLLPRLEDALEQYRMAILTSADLP